LCNSYSSSPFLRHLPALSTYLPQAASKDVSVSLVSEDGAALYAHALFQNVTGGWTKYHANLLSSATTGSARLAVRSVLLSSDSLGRGGKVLACCACAAGVLG
jgi:hypothetical protein